MPHTHTHTQPAFTTEIKPDTTPGTTRDPNPEDVFLSPRVIDSSTLGEFAASLRVILDQAKEQREHLRQTVSESERVVATLHDTAAQATKKLRPATKLLPAIEAKLKQAKQALADAKEAAAVAEAVATAAKTANATLAAKTAPATKIAIVTEAASTASAAKTTISPETASTTKTASTPNTTNTTNTTDTADTADTAIIEARAAQHKAHALNEASVAALQKTQKSLAHATRSARDLETRLSKLTDKAESALDTLDAQCKNQLDQAAKHAQDVLGTTIAEIDTRSDRALKRFTKQIKERASTARAALESTLQIDSPTPALAPTNTPTITPAITSATDQPDAADQADQADAIDYTKHTVNVQLIAHQLTETVTQAREKATRAEANIQTLFDTMTARIDKHASKLQTQLDDRIEQATARTTLAEQAADAAHERAVAAKQELVSIYDQLDAINNRGHEIVTSASHALSAFDQELASRMQTLRQMMEQLACVTAATAPTAPSAPAPTPSTDTTPRNAT